MIFFHHIYCAQSKVKWGEADGGPWGELRPCPQPPHSDATEVKSPYSFIISVLE